MYKELLETINQKVLSEKIDPNRIAILDSLAAYIQAKVKSGEDIHLNFICTHNSRRSHLAQIWAQVASAYYGIPSVQCYSGGTEETALYPMVRETLSGQGFTVIPIAQTSNPIYAIKHSENALPLIGFSKKYDHPFNPLTSFAAILTCSQADEGCPFIPGAEKRFPLNYEDPKAADGTTQAAKVYEERSLQIASELFYVFSKSNP